MLTKEYIFQQAIKQDDPFQLAHLRIAHLNPTDTGTRISSVPLAVKESVNNPFLLRRKLPLFCGLDLPFRTGGKNLSALQMVDFFISAGYYDLDLRDVIGAGHAGLLKLLNTSRFDKELKEVAAGEAYFGIAITEEQAGSNIYGIETVAVPNAGGYTLKGKKKFVARISECTHILVMAKILRADKALLSVFLVSKAALEKSITRYNGLNCSGLKGNSWSEIHFENLQLPDSALLGGEGCGISLFKKHFTYWRTAMSCAAIGSAEHALELAAHQLNSRLIAKRKLADFSHNQLEHGYHLSRIRQCRLLVKEAMSAIDLNDREAYILSVMAKASVVEDCLNAARWSKKIHGASGLVDDAQHPLIKICNDLEALTVADGSSNMLQCTISKFYLNHKL